MKPNKYRLTPQAYKEIEIIAAALPKFQRTDNIGKMLFRQTSTLIDAGDLTQKEIASITDFDYKRRYIRRGQEPLLVNHSIALREVYQKEGQTGIEAYCNYFTNLHKEQKTTYE